MSHQHVEEAAMHHKPFRPLTFLLVAVGLFASACVPDPQPPVVEPPAWMVPGTCYGGAGLGSDIRYLGPPDTIGNYQNFAGTAPYAGCSTEALTSPTAIVRSDTNSAATAKCQQLRGSSSVGLNMRSLLGYSNMPADAWGCS